MPQGGSQDDKEGLKTAFLALQDVTTTPSRRCSRHQNLAMVDTQNVTTALDALGVKTSAV